jgi:predicted nuclease with TOPRIM domain
MTFTLLWPPSLSLLQVSLKSQLEAQADELVEALKERDSLLAKLEQVQAEAEALRNETLPLRQVETFKTMNVLALLFSFC